jgi:glycerol-3-phosphate dehydrogenase
VVNSAGLQADEVAALAGSGDFRLLPLRGEYLIADKEAGGVIGLPVYPLPPEDGVSLGVHITPTLEGDVLLGPSSEFVEGKDDTATTRAVAERLKDEAFRLVPALAGFPFIHAYAGLRPRLAGAGGGTGSADFVVAESDRRPGWIDLVGIESPGLTAAPALAEMVAGIIGAREDLKQRGDLAPERPASRARFAGLDDGARRGLVAADPAWGEMVCRCEHVPRAEVEAALRDPFGSWTLDAIKRRTRCGMGRCQGGFCGPRLVEILQEEGVALDRITKRGPGSELFLGRVKG